MINVVFSSKNGSATIGKVLDGYTSCISPSCGWRLIVVDNGSADNTSLIVQQFKEALPLTLIRHDEPGKNGSLNRAVMEIDGELIVFTDDDAVPNAGFLTEWARISETVLDHDVFGGVVDPVFPSQLPEFLERSRHVFDILYAEVRAEEGPTDPSMVFGPNMAIRGRIFQQGIRFNEQIGPNSLIQNYGMGSESELCDRLFASGFKFWFNAGSAVGHLVRPNQMEWDFFKRRAFRHGLGVGTRHKLSHAGRGFLAPGKRLRWSLENSLLKLLPEPSASDPQSTWQRNWRLGYIASQL